MARGRITQEQRDKISFRQRENGIISALELELSTLNPKILKSLPSEFVDEAKQRSRHWQKRARKLKQLIARLKVYRDAYLNEIYVDEDDEPDDKTVLEVVIMWRASSPVEDRKRAQSVESTGHIQHETFLISQKIVIATAQKAPPLESPIHATELKYFLGGTKRNKAAAVIEGLTTGTKRAVQGKSSDSGTAKSAP